MVVVLPAAGSMVAQKLPQDWLHVCWKQGSVRRLQRLSPAMLQMPEPVLRDLVVILDENVGVLVDPTPTGVAV